MNVSMQPNRPSISINARLSAAFESARNERFEDGMESQFTRALDALAMVDPREVLRSIQGLLRTADPSVASEALRWIGRSDDFQTHELRLSILIENLGAPFSEVRDGAGLGLSFLDDPEAIPALEAAIEREGFEDLKEDRQLVVDQLKATEQCR